MSKREWGSKRSMRDTIENTTPRTMQSGKQMKALWINTGDQQDQPQCQECTGHRLKKPKRPQLKRLTASLIIKRKKFMKKRTQFVFVLAHKSEHIKGLYMVS
eukprot:1156533-Pelagomonas_calceolata.AAC.1